MKFQKLVTNISPLMSVHCPTQEGQQIKNWSKQKRNPKIDLWNSNGRNSNRKVGSKKWYHIYRWVIQ